MSDRRIFKFNDGTQERFADPIAAIRKFATLDGVNLQEDLAAIGSGDVSAMSRIIEASRKVFGLKPFSDAEGSTDGVLDEEVLNIMNAFGEFVKSLFHEPKEVD